MLNPLLHTDFAQAIIGAQNSPAWARAKKLLLVLAALWLSYFLLVNWFVHSLNKIAVPVLEMPLGIFLAIQGAAVVFAITLFRLARTAG